MRIRYWSTGLAAAISVMGLGCGKSESKVGKDGDKGVAVAEVADDHKGHDHSGWWCDEHGIPEEICAQCNSKVAADYKRQGDWCKEHDRPDSQCFICHPELEAKFAARYEAKYGRRPPKPEEHN